MKILLVYSRKHFDPDKKPREHAYWGSSASILARSFHKILGEMGQVSYADSSEADSLPDADFDMVVCAPAAFDKVRRRYPRAKSVAIAVNRHPLARMAAIESAQSAWGLPRAATKGEYLDTGVVGIEKADAVLCFGDETVLQSWVDQGVPRNRIRRLHYGIPGRGAAADRTPPGAGARRLLYAASAIGLRKGFDVLDAQIRGAMAAGLEFSLDILGLPSNPYYESKLEALVKDASGRVSFHGWQDSAGQAYQDILARADFLVFPSFEEGQAGTVLDALAAGVVPILSPGAGVPFSPLGFLELLPGSRNDAMILDRALSLDGGELQRLRALSASYYASFHGRFEESLRSALAGVSRGRLYPKVSVVLPVFNKEKVFSSLLGQLDEACRSYGNADLQLIFDGCKDASEKIGRGFFSGRNDYPVAITVTPNIFEVRSNNLGIQSSDGEFCAIVQDDNFIFDPFCFFEAVDLFTINPAIAVVGGLAGVNYYPRGHQLPAGPGQKAQTENEVYWRQDAATDGALSHSYFEVDACMRGPLLLRRSFIEAHGAFDEAYAPLYMDDMDLCFRAREKGWQVWAFLMDVENRSLTMAFYDAERNRFFTEIQRRNTELFYSRHSPSTDKSRHLRIGRSHKKESVPMAWTLERRIVRLEQRARSVWGAFKQLVKRLIRRRPRP